MIIEKSFTFAAPLNSENTVTAASLHNMKVLSLPSSAAVVTAYTQSANGDKSGFFTLTPGDVYEFAKDVERLVMKSDTAGVVKWQQSSQDRFRFAPAPGGVVVVIPGTVTVTGTVNNNPTDASLMEDVVSGLNYTMKTSDDVHLLTGGLLNFPGVLGNGAVISTRAFSFLRLVVQNAGVSGDYMTAVDSGDTTLPPLPLYDAQGKLARADGRIYFEATKSPAGTVYYIYTRGVGEVTFVAGVGAPVVSVYKSPLEAIPDGNGGRTLNLTAADLGITLGAFPGGIAAATIAVTANVAAILTAFGFKPKRLSFNVNYTPAGVDTYVLEGRSAVGASWGPRGTLVAGVASTAAAWAAQCTIRDAGTVVGIILNDGAVGTPTSLNSPILPANDMELRLRKTTGVAAGTLDAVNLIFQE